MPLLIKCWVGLFQLFWVDGVEVSPLPTARVSACLCQNNFGKSAVKEQHFEGIANDEHNGVQQPKKMVVAVHPLYSVSSEIYRAIAPSCDDESCNNVSNALKNTVLL